MDNEFKARISKLRIRTESLLLKAKRTGRARIPGDGDGDGIPNEGKKPKGQVEAGPTYGERVQGRVNEGMSRSDAQGVTDAENLGRSKHSRPPKAPALNNEDQKGADNMPDSKKYQDSHIETVNEALRTGNMAYAQSVRRRAAVNHKYFAGKGSEATANHWKAIGSYADAAAKHIAWRSKAS